MLNEKSNNQRCSQQIPMDFGMLGKSQQRVSTGMLDANRHNLHRRQLAAHVEKLSKEEGDELEENEVDGEEEAEEDEEEVVAVEARKHKDANRTMKMTKNIQKQIKIGLTTKQQPLKLQEFGSRRTHFMVSASQQQTHGESKRIGIESMSCGGLPPIGEEDRKEKQQKSNESFFSFDQLKVDSANEFPFIYSGINISNLGKGETTVKPSSAIHNVDPSITVKPEDQTQTESSDRQESLKEKGPIDLTAATERHSVSTSEPSRLETGPSGSRLLGERGKMMLTRQRSHVSYAEFPSSGSYRRAPRAGAIITSARLSRRRSSNWAAVKAFAVATAASTSQRRVHGANSSKLKPPCRHTVPFTASLLRQSLAGPSPFKREAQSSAGTLLSGTILPALGLVTLPSSPSSLVAKESTSGAGETGVATTIGTPPPIFQKNPSTESKESIVAGITVLRIMNIVRQWITKYPADFDGDPVLKSKMQTLLEELLRNPRLNANSQKVAFQLSREMLNDQLVESKIDLDRLLSPTQVPSKESFATIAALDIAEQLTYLDFHIFKSIRTEELLNQAWMKEGKETKAPHVTLVSKRFNEVSKLVVSEIVSRKDVFERVACIEKWIAIADICRCLQNYNGVLQICAALENSSVHRLKTTWEGVSKQIRQTFEKLLSLVTTNARFKNMREALHRCDLPCIPYLGMYLTDLSFIEEGALDINENGLINFCKMRMLAHVLMEVRRYHQTPYLIEMRQDVLDYLLDQSRLLTDDQTYEASLCIEPRHSPFDRKSLVIASE